MRSDLCVDAQSVNALDATKLWTSVRPDLGLLVALLFDVAGDLGLRGLELAVPGFERF